MIKPLHKNILISPHESPYTAVQVEDKDTIEEADVIEVGNEVEQIKKGDVILYKDYSTDKIEIKDKEYLFIKEEDVLALV